MKVGSSFLPLVLISAVNCYSQGPLAVPGPDLSITLGEPVHFDASRSKATRGDQLVSWEWDFDNLDGVRGDATAVAVDHYYNYAGSYTAALTVRDKQGRTDQTWQRIEVCSPVDWGPTLVDRFEGGRSGVVSRSEADFTLYNQWGLQWYFRLDNVAGVPISIRIFGYGPARKVPIYVTPYNDDQSFNENFVPYVNYDFSDPRWERLTDAKLAYEEKTCSLTIRHTFSRSPVYLAWSPPYMPSDLDRYLATLRGNKYCRADVLGKSVEGRDLKIITVTDFLIPDAKKYSIWMIGQQHGYEMVGGPICEGIVRQLLSPDVGQSALEKFVFKLVPVVNPDAMAHGGFRYNMHDVDLNRNWDSLGEGYADRS